jgi:hypothetical protein
MSPLIPSVVVILAAATADVSLVTSDSVVRMSEYRGSVRLIYRNTSGYLLKDLHVETRADRQVEVSVRPQKIPRCLPSDRCVFELEVKRVKETPEERFFLLVDLHSDRRLHQRQIMVDATPQALTRERGWMEAGQIQVGTRGKTGRVLVLALLCAVPVVLLLLLGLYFKKRSAT